MNYKTIKKIVSVVVIISLLSLAGCAPVEGGAEGTNSMLTMLPMMGLMFVVFYFFIIRPENKKKKEQAKMRDELGVGDTITTIGGMVGRIVHMKDELVTFETGEDRVRVQIMKWAIQTPGKDKTNESK